MGWVAGASAANRRRRKRREERRIITELQEADLAGQYEFKVLRSYGFAFCREEGMRAALEQEAAAGWELVRKLDGSRLVLRRQVSRRESDHLLPADRDPYRTDYDANIPMLAAVAMGLYMVLWLVVFSTFEHMVLAAVIGGVVILAATAVLAVTLNRR